MRIAFSLIGAAGWTGGSHYLKNLLQTLHEASVDSLETVMFSSRKRVSEIEPLTPYLSGKVLNDNFTVWSPGWFARQIARKVLDRDIVVERLMKRRGVDAVFHAGVFGTRFSLPCVNWIADFQHLHMPEMFSKRELKVRNRLFLDLARMCRRLVVSSESVRKDFEFFAPDYRDRVDVLPFVAHIQESVFNSDPRPILKSYRIPAKFFHLPNQFWKHKNHIVVLEALKLLKERKSDIFVVCTGNEKDYRNPGYVESLKEFIVKNRLNERIVFLGLVPLDHLYALMRQSVALINPSLFEGWSTTVEESKSLGKRILLSDIPVHREQSPPGGTYFSPLDPEDLVEKLMKVWNETVAGPDLNMERTARDAKQQRSRAFAVRFIEIMNKACYSL
jgi:glycosyltransferase involved in cell wall biosynthesis